MLARRSFLFGLGTSLIAAPAIVRAASLMPVKALPLTVYGHSPAMVALPDLAELSMLKLRIANLIANPPYLIDDDGICRPMSVDHHVEALRLLSA